jgi:hypothetical protein
MCGGVRTQAQVVQPNRALECRPDVCLFFQKYFGIQWCDIESVLSECSALPVVSEGTFLGCPLCLLPPEEKEETNANDQSKGKRDTQPNRKVAIRGLAFTKAGV